MTKSASTGTSPELPSIARKPLEWVPMAVKAQAITSAMNALFATPLQAGELGFLARRVMVYTFLLLATRKEDADTLFFRRQLKTSGDTELGLHVKNFLDGLEPETLPYHQTIDPILRGSLAIADRVDKIRNRLSSSRMP